MKSIVLGIAALVLVAGTRAQEFLEVPIPRVTPGLIGKSPSPKPLIRDPWWMVDKDVTALGLLHGAAAIMDGITTRRCTTMGTMEGDPVDRFFLGPKPTWARMIPFGGMEVYGTALLAQHMKHSRFKAVRMFYLAPQIYLIGLHTSAGANNVKIRASLVKEGY